MALRTQAYRRMTSPVRRLTSISLLWQILLPMLLCVAIGIAAVQLCAATRTLLQERLTASVSGNIAMLQADVARFGTAMATVCLSATRC
jgi:hypothetical protein